MVLNPVQPAVGLLVNYSNDYNFYNTCLTCIGMGYYTVTRELLMTTLFSNLPMSCLMPMFTLECILINTVNLFQPNEPPIDGSLPAVLCFIVSQFCDYFCFNVLYDGFLCNAL